MKKISLLNEKVLKRAVHHSAIWKLTVYNALASLGLAASHSVFPAGTVLLSILVLLLSVYFAFYSSSIQQVFNCYSRYIEWKSQDWDFSKTVSLVFCAVTVFILAKGVIFAPGSVSFPAFVCALACFVVAQVRFTYHMLDWMSWSKDGGGKTRELPAELLHIFKTLEEEWKFTIVAGDEIMAAKICHDNTTHS